MKINIFISFVLFVLEFFARKNFEKKRAKQNPLENLIKMF